MTLDELRSIRADIDPLTVLQLPAPDAELLNRWRPEALEAALKWARAQWLYLLTADLALPDAAAYNDEELKTPELFAVLVSIIGVWFKALNEADRSVSKSHNYNVVFPLADAARLNELAISEPLNGSPFRSALFTARAGLAEYISFIIAAALVPALTSSPLGGTGVHAVMEDLAHSSLARLHRLSLDAPFPQLRDLFDRLVEGGLADLAEAYHDRATGWRPGSWRPGPFSDLRVEELPLLAGRHEATIKRYGVKRVEKRFEQQLALLFQSLGFVVIETRSGSRTVDLVCISMDPNHRVTFLVEAKTSKSVYGLPAKDERALHDYVADFNRTLTTLPPLRFVMLVAHNPAKALSRKLRAFETQTGTPIRFVSALSLAQLRSDLPGPAPVGPFVELLLNGPPTTSSEFVSSLTGIYAKQQEAHKQFAQALLATGQAPFDL
jgi:hypothetical protein